MCKTPEELGQKQMTGEDNSSRRPNGHEIPQKVNFEKFFKCFFFLINKSKTIPPSHHGQGLYRRKTLM